MGAIGRRGFVAGLGSAAVSWPLTARAQPAPPVIGFLHPDSPADIPGNMEGFSRGLAETGYVEGRNVAVEHRWANRRYDQLPALAAELVGRRVNVIAAGGSSAPGLAAKAATTSIPIVFQTGADPVADGLVASMNRPGANVTGVSRFSVALDPKRIELLHEAVPKAAVVAFLVNAGSPRADMQVKQIEESARSLGVTLKLSSVSAQSDLDGAFAAWQQQGVGAMLVASDPAMTSWAERIVALALRYAMPAMFNARSFVEAGGLMSYDSSLTDSFRQVGAYVGRILKGDKPADLPILEPTKFDFILNLKTAKALGLEIPLKLHAFAEEVIE
jgi:putative ABC transport system substrate-binding protein